MANHLLQEAVESVVKTDPIVASIKKSLNVCKLSKFKSVGECAKFYSTFFCCTMEDPGQQPTVEQWGSIYNSLLSQGTFCIDLACYMALYQPAEYTNIFAPLMGQIKAELETMKGTRIRYLHMTKAMIMNLQDRLNGVGQMVRSQVINPNPLKFVTVVDQVLQQMVFDLSNMVQEETTKEADMNKDAISYIPVEEAPLSEAAQELIALLEGAPAWYETFMVTDEHPNLNEGVVNNAKMKAKELLIKQKKAEEHFDEAIMTKVRKMRETRRNRKHSEMVGESLRVTNELKRILKVLPLALLNPAASVIAWAVSVIIDRQTDKRDRDILVNQLKDEIEITDEKISQAERNGDDKAKVQLMRFKQKLVHEYERIQHVRYDASTRVRYNKD